MSQWIYDVYTKKTNYAKSINEKKVVIVAGSNTLFGLDSQKIAKEYNIPVVNYGVNAGLLLPYILYKSKEVINPNDIVILPLEYPMYNYDGEPNEQMIDYIFSRDFNAFFYLTFKEQFLMIWNITFNRLVNGYTDKNKPHHNTGFYGAHNTNIYGEQIKTEEKYKNKNIQKELNNHKANSYGKDFNKKNLSWNYLADFVNWCEKKKVKVIFMPSTMMYFEAYKQDLEEKRFYETLPLEIEKRGWIFVGNPYDYMYDKKYYFNTDFHLTSEGKEIRTNQIVKDLKNKL
jgi:hypothetical protein